MPYRDNFPDCPRCDIALEPLKLLIGGHEILNCKQCGGNWTTVAEFQSIAAVLAPGKTVAEQPREDDEQPLSCPECGRVMTKLSVATVPLDRCDLHGLWFDFAELQKVLTQLSRGS